MIKTFTRVVPGSIIVSTLVCLSSCGHRTPSGSEINSLFRQLPVEQTNIRFENTLTEGLNTNVLLYEYFYNGGGVAVGDLNGDGRQEIYFTGNMVDNKLYLNNGHMKFEDV